jgi:hypothetical protein
VLVCPRCRSIYDTTVQFCAIDGEKIVEQEQDPLVGQIFADRYRIITESSVVWARAR